MLSTDFPMSKLLRAEKDGRNQRGATAHCGAEVKG